MKWPALIVEARQAIDYLDKLIEDQGINEYQDTADELREQVEDLVTQERSAPLKKKIEQITDLRYKILFSQPSFWVGYFGYLEQHRNQMSDVTTADRLFNQGYQSIKNENISGLSNVVIQLLNLLPSEVVEEVKRGYESGVLK